MDWKFIKHELKMQNKLKIFMFLYLKYTLFILFFFAVLLPAFAEIVINGRWVNDAIDIHKNKALSELSAIPFDKIFSKDGLFRIMDIILIPAFFITLHEMTVGFSCVLWLLAAVVTVFISWTNSNELTIQLRQSIGLSTPMMFVTTYIAIMFMKLLRIYNLCDISRFFR